jgi:hypothetical protein
MANYVHMQWLMQGLSFASTPSPCLFAGDPQHSFVGIAGVTVTRSFDYIKDLHILASFFWPYAHLNHSQCGYNTSISPALPEDLQQIQHVEKCLRDENPAHCEFRIIMVPDRNVPKVETPFIISFPPKYTARSPFRQAT